MNWQKNPRLSFSTAANSEKTDNRGKEKKQGDKVDGGKVMVEKRIKNGNREKGAYISKTESRLQTKISNELFTDCLMATPQTSE